MQTIILVICHCHPLDPTVKDMLLVGFLWIFKESLNGGHYFLIGSYLQLIQPNLTFMKLIVNFNKPLNLFMFALELWNYWFYLVRIKLSRGRKKKIEGSLTFYLQNEIKPYFQWVFSWDKFGGPQKVLMHVLPNCVPVRDLFSRIYLGVKVLWVYLKDVM